MTAHSFFKSYLSDHIQCVQINEILHGTTKLKCKVLQETMLEPYILWYMTLYDHTYMQIVSTNSA